MNNPFTYNQTFDIGGPDILTYESLLKQTADALGKKRWFIPMPLLMPWMVRRWLCFIASAPKNLVFPLVQSLKHSIRVRPKNILVVPNSRPIPFFESVQRAISAGALREKPHAYCISKEVESRHEVRSIQRMTLPKNMHADAVSFAYQHWLPRFLWPFLSVKKTSNKVAFQIWGIKTPLLLLELSYQRSSSDRQLLYIKGGLLAQDNKRGRLEFREVLGGKYLIAAIHEFRPAMPWWIYVHTQAPIHLLVMNSFNKWLRQQEKTQTKTTELSDSITVTNE